MRKIACTLLAILLLFSMALAEIPEKTDDFWYLDQANVLSDATEGEIFFASEALYKTGGAGIVVVTVDSTGETSLEDYAYQLFNKWDICGDTGYGLLLVLAIEDDDYRITTGTGMDALIPGDEVYELLNTYLEPHFAVKEYDAGVCSVYEALFSRISDILKLDLDIADAKSEAEAYIKEHTVYADDAQTETTRQEAATEQIENQSRRGGSIMAYIIVIIILLAIFGGASRGAHRRRRPPMAPPPRPHGGFFGGPRRPMGGGPRGGGSMFGGPGGGFGGPRGGASRGGGFSGGSRGGRGGFSGGFGGSSHRSGGGRGPASRGGGAGRGR